MTLNLYFYDFKEDFLQLVWNYQYFEEAILHTASGEALKIIHAGFYNQSNGPDFHDAAIVIGGVSFHGYVEVLRVASEWKQHAHGGSPAYNSFVLQLVWEGDLAVLRDDANPMPAIELKGLFIWMSRGIRSEC